MSTAILDRPPATPVTEEPPLEEAYPVLPRLSEAMRKGAMYHRQAHGYTYCRLSGTTCALGALGAGLLGREEFERGEWRGSLDVVVYKHTAVRLDQMVPRRSQPPVLRPWLKAMRMERVMLMQVIAYLNDEAKWSRERIADWLESIGF